MSCLTQKHTGIVKVCHETNIPKQYPPVIHSGGTENKDEKQHSLSKETWHYSLSNSEKGLLWSIALNEQSTCIECVWMFNKCKESYYVITETLFRRRDGFVDKSLLHGTSYGGGSQMKFWTFFLCTSLLVLIADWTKP